MHSVGTLHAYLPLHPTSVRTARPALLAMRLLRMAQPQHSATPQPCHSAGARQAWRDWRDWRDVHVVAMCALRARESAQLRQRRRLDPLEHVAAQSAAHRLPMRRAARGCCCCGRLGQRRRRRRWRCRCRRRVASGGLGRLLCFEPLRRREILLGGIDLDGEAVGRMQPLLLLGDGDDALFMTLSTCNTHDPAKL